MNSHLDNLENLTPSLHPEPMPHLNSQSESAQSATDSDIPSSAKVRVEEFQINSDYLMAKIKELIQQGNVRRLTVKNAQGRTLVDIPLIAGVVGGMVGVTVFPLAVAVTAVAALVSRFSVVVERKED